MCGAGHMLDQVLQTFMSAVRSVQFRFLASQCHLEKVALYTDLFHIPFLLFLK